MTGEYGLAHVIEAKVHPQLLLMNSLFAFPPGPFVFQFVTVTYEKPCWNPYSTISVN